MPILGALSDKNKSFVNNLKQQYLSHIPDSDFSEADGHLIGCSSFYREADTSCTAYSGRPFLNDKLLSPKQLHSHLILRSTDMLPLLKGAFSIAHFNARTKETLLAVDRMGREKLAFRHLEGCLLFSSNVTWIASIQGREAAILNQALYDYLFFHMVPAPQTVFKGVEKLSLGHCLVGSPSGWEVKKYWSPDYQYTKRVSEQELAESLHATLRDAVKRTNPGTTSGAFLSGGLDSSTVCGFLAEIQPGAARSFSMGFGVPEYDELGYARIAAEKFHLQAHEYRVTPADVEQCLPKIAEAFDEPFGNSSVIPTYCCARFAAENGIDHLLAGDGGDELFAGNERYAKQKVFELYYVLPEFVRNTFVSPVARAFSEDSFLPLRKLHSYVQQAEVPLPERLEAWNFSYREGLSYLLDTNFSGTIDVEGPMKLMRAVYEETSAPHTLDKLLAYDWKFTLADNDLRKVTTMCELAGVKVSYPMLDDDLVEFSTTIPPAMKMKRFQLRSFYKHAMQGFLPNAILTKRKHGFGLPFGHWLKSESGMRNLVLDALSDLKKRHFFQSRFIDQVIEEQEVGHASYYGYFIWDLTILEMWLQNKSL